jgi:hypothetical protein
MDRGLSKRETRPIHVFPVRRTISRGFSAKGVSFSAVSLQKSARFPYRFLAKKMCGRLARKCASEFAKRRAVFSSIKDAVKLEWKRASDLQKAVLFFVLFLQETVRFLCAFFLRQKKARLARLTPGRAFPVGAGIGDQGRGRVSGGTRAAAFSTGAETLRVSMGSFAIVFHATS